MSAEHGISKELTGDAFTSICSDTNWLLSHLKLFAQIEQLVTWHDSAYAPVVFILRESKASTFVT